MRAAACVVFAAAGGCGFQIPATATGDDAPPGLDAPRDTGDPDTPPAPRLCDPAPGLIGCFSFDAPVFASPLANEGSAAVVAEHDNVDRVPCQGGGAAQVGTTSRIQVLPNTELTGIASAEAWVRIDADPATGGRVGIVDADATSAAVSFFYYRPGAYQIRFELGVQLFLDHQLSLGDWHYLAQTCEGGVLTAYVDGSPVGSRTGCSPGVATTYGLQLGQNNNQASGNEWLTGALDGVRLWTTVRTPAEICAAAGRTSCP